MQVSNNGLNLITQFEGFSTVPYLDQNNVSTIGYGSTYYSDGTRVTMDDSPVTQEQALQLLDYSCQTAVNCINRLVQIDLNQNQFDALVDFVYNVGSGNFQSSTLLKDINSNNLADIPNQFMRWNKVAGQPNNGLTRRRQAEINLWNE